jgi:hypothetical protein
LRQIKGENQMAVRRSLILLMALSLSSAANGQSIDRFNDGVIFRGISSFTFGGQLRAVVAPADCTAPGYSFQGDTDTGIGYNTTNAFYFCAGAAARMSISASSITSTVAVASDIFTGTGTASQLRLAEGNGVTRLTNNAGTDFARLQFGGTTSSFPAIKRSGTAIQARLADDSGWARVEGERFLASLATITAGSGTGISVVNEGQLQRQVYKVTIDRTAFVCAALTCDVTIATLPAKTSVLSVYGHIETVFACTATCTSSTLSMLLGSTAGGAQYLASFDADLSTSVFGDADAELGTTMTRAAAIQGGNAVPNFSSTTPVNLRLTSGTGNIGNGSATNLSQGSVTFYIVTERLP